MTNRKFMVGVDCKELIETAVGKRLPLTITTRQDKNWQVYKSNFIAIQSNRLYLAHPTPDMNDCHTEMATGQEIAVSFKKGYYKNLFVTRSISQDRFEIDSGVFMPVIVVMFPEQIERIQRRAYNRAEVPSNEIVDVTFERLEDDHIVDRKQWHGHLVDLSAGGLGVKINKDAAVDLNEGDQFKLTFVPMSGQDPIEINSRFRHATNTDDPNEAMLGFQIIGQEMDEIGRNVLRRIGRIVNLYQRQQNISKHPNLIRK